MKILCSRRVDIDLDRFAGKDLWVLMYYSYPSLGASNNYREDYLCWVRVLDFMIGPGTQGPNTKLYVVNTASASLFTVSDDLTQWSFCSTRAAKEECLTWQEYPVQGLFHVHTPFEAKTTAELFGDDTL